MRTQKGFMSMSVLIAIVATIFAVGVGVYIGVEKYQRAKHEKELVAEEKAKVAQEREIATQVLIQDQQKQLQETQKEIEDLRQQTKATQISVRNTQSAPIVSQEISSTELQPYLNTIGVLTCWDPNFNRVYGTGVLLSPGKLMTNWHVVEGMDWCGFVNSSFLNPKYELTGNNYRPGEYVLDLSNIQRPGTGLDFAIVPFAKNSSTIAQQYHGAPTDEYLEVSQLNYKVGSMQKCSAKVAVGNPVAILGYPASSINIEEFAPPQSVTTGIISGYQAAYQSNNYLVSAKVDHGNSGGLALGKENGKVCLLGIPTWVVTGEVESAGIVQNIRALLN